MSANPNLIMETMRVRERERERGMENERIGGCTQRGQMARYTEHVPQDREHKKARVLFKTDVGRVFH